MPPHLHRSLIIITALLCCAASIASAQTRPFDLRSEILTPSVKFDPRDPAFHEIRLRGQIDVNGDGQGTLTLDPNGPTFDDFGTGLMVRSTQQPLKLEVAIQFVRTGRTQIQAGPPPEQWHLYRIKNDQLKTSIGLAAPNRQLTSGRLLVYGPDNNIVSVIPLNRSFASDTPPLPCHPGCFPAGTLVTTPSGSERIENLAPGSVVITLDDDGAPQPRPIRNIFVVDNDVLKIQTDFGSFVTTETQPLRLANGTTTGAGALSHADAILRWESGKTIPAKILSIQKQYRATRVHNLVFDQTTHFIANGYIVRSKPPPPK
ncbi:MAG: hypothetical protein HKN47_03480 [Pirellulaceae bacterium]|nr:hypothetical protein [Pirellulaceae bacterium]